MSTTHLAPDTRAMPQLSPTASRVLQAVLAIIAGGLFGAGLIIGGMTDPSKVLNFLDFTGKWEPALAFVMAGGVAVHFLLMQFVLKRKSPLFEEAFHLPTKRDLDGRLLAGAAIFGTGWGLAGYCPGPGLVAGGAALQGATVFVLTMLIGMILQHGVFDPKPHRTNTPC
jgi:uncharacterized membrane protein YedE/YeeE